MAERAAKALRRQARSAQRTPKCAMRVLGPAPAPIERLRGAIDGRWWCDSTEASAMRAALASMQTELGARDTRGGVFVGIDLDPVNML